MSSIKKLFDDFAGGQEHRVLLIGLDAAGKTTLLYKVKVGETVHTVPTIGFNVEDVKVGSLQMTIWDVGGQHTIRPLWRHYYHGSTGIIFMVDSADQERMKEAQECLAHVLDAEELRNSALLVFANKQDLNGSLSVAEIADAMGCTSMYNRKWHVQGCCATTGDGVFEGFQWLSGALKTVPRA